MGCWKAWPWKFLPTQSLFGSTWKWCGKPTWRTVSEGGFRKSVMVAACVTCVMGQMRLGWCQFSFVHIPPVCQRAGGGRDLNDYIIPSRLDLWKMCQDPASSTWSSSYQCGTFLTQKCHVCVLVQSEGRGGRLSPVEHSWWSPIPSVSLSNLRS